MSFDWHIINKSNVDLEKDILLQKLVYAYIDLYNYSCNKIIWSDVREILKENRDFLESKGIIINPVDHSLAEIRS